MTHESFKKEALDMQKKTKRRVIPLIFLVFLNTAVKARHSGNAAGVLGGQAEKVLLADDDKAEITAARRLRNELGEQIWPGFGQAKIPIILYDDRYEFLVGAENPPQPWLAVEGDDYAGSPYFRRNAARSDSFAVLVGGYWAGSLSTLQRMSRKIPIKIGIDLHLAMMLHEMFHAFQAGTAQARFSEALKAYAQESRYPVKDGDFAAAWDREGGLLASGLKANEDSTIRRTAQAFLDQRAARRSKMGFGPDLIAYERGLEWLEGLAKYAEMQVYELAAGQKDDPLFSPFRSGHPLWRMDFFRLEKALGRQEGDLRFYLSGLAQARLLDKLNPGWKEKGLAGVCLEDMLRDSLINKGR
jgi:hypothetical protein